MSDATAKEIAAHARKQATQWLGDIEHCHGMLTANAQGEGMLEAVSLHLARTIGPRATFEIFSRHADAVIAAVASSEGRK